MLETDRHRGTRRTIPQPFTGPFEGDSAAQWLFPDEVAHGAKKALVLRPGPEPDSWTYVQQLRPGVSANVILQPAGNALFNEDQVALLVAGSTGLYFATVGLDNTGVDYASTTAVLPLRLEDEDSDLRQAVAEIQGVEAAVTASALAIVSWLEDACLVPDRVVRGADGSIAFYFFTEVAAAAPSRYAMIECGSDGTVVLFSDRSQAEAEAWDADTDEERDIAIARVREFVQG